ncbi:MAG: alpha/beta hydrolase [Spirochaetota bacterium]
MHLAPQKYLKYRFGIGLVLVFAAIYALGPKIEVDTKLKTISIPADLDRYLLQSEKKYQDIRPYTQKQILWYDSQKRKTEYAIVYLHGFSASRQEIVPVCEIIAQELQANLFYTRLKGHARTGQALANATTNDWLHDGQEALLIGEKLGKKIIVIAVSTGATLSVWLANHKRLQNKIHAQVLISPNFSPKANSSAIILQPWGRELTRLLLGDYRENTTATETMKKYWTVRYPIEAIFAMMGMVSLVDKIDLRQMSTPTLILHSNFDQVISVAKIHKRFQEIGAKVKRRIEVNDAQHKKGHIIAGDILSPKTNTKVVQHILDFIADREKISTSPRSSHEKNKN